MGKLAGLAATPRLKRGAGAVRAMWRAALDLALPRLCAACREPVEGQGLCPACWSKLSFITRPYCERFGIPFVYDPGPGILSMEAIADPPAYPSRARRGALRRNFARPGACPQIWRPARSRADYGALDRPGRPGASGRGRYAGADTAALAPAAGAAVQPIGHAGRRRLGAISGVPITAGALKRVKATHPTGGTVAIRTHRQRAGRIPRAAGGKAGRGRPPSRPDRRRADVGRHRRGLRQGAPSRRRRQCRCPGVRQGCRSRANVHIRV